MSGFLNGGRQDVTAIDSPVLPPYIPHVPKDHGETDTHHWNAAAPVPGLSLHDILRNSCESLGWTVNIYADVPEPLLQYLEPLLKPHRSYEGMLAAIKLRDCEEIKKSHRYYGTKLQIALMIVAYVVLAIFCFCSVGLHCLIPLTIALFILIPLSSKYWDTRPLMYFITTSVICALAIICTIVMYACGCVWPDTLGRWATPVWPLK